MEQNACVHILMKQRQDTKISCFSLVETKMQLLDTLFFNKCFGWVIMACKLALTILAAGCTFICQGEDWRSVTRGLLEV